MSVSVAEHLTASPVLPYPWETAATLQDRERLWWEQYRDELMASIANLKRQRQVCLAQNREYRLVGRDGRIAQIDRNIECDLRDLCEINQRLIRIEARS